MESRIAVLDGNQAVAEVAHRLNEVIAIYPITPSSAMGEWADQWSSERRPNLWGTVPRVIEMQSEGGAAGAVHGALQGGALTTTFTASQGLLLMIPNLYKIAGELTPAVIHVAARAIAAQALSIFGDHSDVMACRATGWAMLCSGSVQEACDFAAVAQFASLESRIPFLHFFDGFRTSHEVSRIATLGDDDLLALADPEAVHAHRSRALSPDHPVLRGTAQNPDVYFQAREAGNPFYDRCADVVERGLERLAGRVGRRYRLFEYHGHPEAERVIVLMGSGAETVHETVDQLLEQGERVGVVKVRLYRPFDGRRFVESLPRSVRTIAVLDRTKEPGSAGEPLYLDCVAALAEHADAASHESAGARGCLPVVVGGRYGLSSKEFTPPMVMAVFDHLVAERPRNHFTVGIHDDVTHTSLFCDEARTVEAEGVTQAVFWGLGADGTVGANKSSIKIIGERTGQHVQGYFVYDSRKSGAVTISHLRFGPRPIRSSYLIQRPRFVACHQWQFLGRYDVLGNIADGGTFLLVSPYPADAVWEQLPASIQQTILDRHIAFHVIDAVRVARECRLGGYINTVMQTCFFALANLLPPEEARAAIEETIRHDYALLGPEIVARNLNAVSRALSEMYEVDLAGRSVGSAVAPPAVSPGAPGFVRDVLGAIIAGQGDRLPVSAMPVDGTFPTATSRWEKRGQAHEIPVWDPDLCIQCGKCAMVCPHVVIRIKAYPASELGAAPAGFKSMDAKDRDLADLRYTIQVAPDDCTGCAICVDVCPARCKSESRVKALDMKPRVPIREAEAAFWDYFLGIPEIDRARIHPNSIRQQQLSQPLFEFPSACAGCGETPYLKLASQLFGDRMIVANATGCSSIYGGNLPTTPWSQNAQGRGPAWSNSLFEDNAEFGLGIRISVDKQREMAAELVTRLAASLGDDFVTQLNSADQSSEAGLYEQRARVAALKERLAKIDSPDARSLEQLADALVRKSVWIVGGDGWAYDIGFGGLDHVLASGADVNVLVLDTEVYSNTGGQMSKSTPRGAVAKFAAGGKPGPKKDLGRIAMTYGHVYVAQVAMGPRRAHLEGVPRGGGLPGTVADHRVQPLHRARHPDVAGIALAEGRGGKRALAALPPSSGSRRDRREPAHPRLEAAQDPDLAVPGDGEPLPMLTATRPADAKVLFREAQGDVDRQWRLYSELAAAPGAAARAGESEKT